MTKRVPREIAIELISTTIAEVIEDVHELAVGALPQDLRTRRALAQRLMKASQDVAALAGAMEVLVRKA